MEALCGEAIFTLLSKRGWVETIESRIATTGLFKERVIEALCDLLVTRLTDRERELINQKINALDSLDD